MSKDWYNDVKDFHEQIMLDDFPKFPHIPDKKFKDLRKKLIEEEVNETISAIDRNDLIEIADGIADSIVVLLGTAITYGIDIRSVWDEVHKTNMAKKDGTRRADGKLIKPADWQPPKIKEILTEQGMVE